MGLCLLSPLLSAKDVFESMNQEKKRKERKKGDTQRATRKEREI